MERQAARRENHRRDIGAVVAQSGHTCNDPQQTPQPIPIKYYYDAQNRLRKMLDTPMTGPEPACGTTGGSYIYNGDGLRMTRTIGASTVSYKWDVASGLPTILQDSASNTYVGGLDLISRTDSGGAQEHYLTDGLGSTTGLANGTGAVTGTYAYDAFGAIRTQTGSSPNEFKFTGEQVDATGMQYLRARYYDQATGRFLSRDPIPFLQWYAYVGNNPGTFVDPHGLCKNTWNLWEAGKECVDKGGDAVDTVATGAQWTYDNIVEPAATWTYDEVVMCVIEEGGPTECFQDRIFDGLDYLATLIACAVDKESYFDANVAAPIPGTGAGLLILGGQVSCTQGLHPYAGLGAGTAGWAATMAPGQSIGEGLGCGLQVFGAVPTDKFGSGGQVGLGGGLENTGLYREVGVGTPGYSYSCFWIGPRMGD